MICSTSWDGPLWLCCWSPGRCSSSATMLGSDTLLLHGTQPRDERGDGKDPSRGAPAGDPPRLPAYPRGAPSAPQGDSGAGHGGRQRSLGTSIPPCPPASLPAPSSASVPRPLGISSLPGGEHRRNISPPSGKAMAPFSPVGASPESSYLWEQFQRSKGLLLWIKPAPQDL